MAKVIARCYQASMANKKHSSASFKETLDDVLVRVRKAGLKLTPAREEVLRLLLADHGPFSVEEIHEGIHVESCNLATVYRILNTFESNELVRKCDLGDRITRYELHSHDHLHHHLVCSTCKHVEVVEIGQVPDLTKVAKKKGFVSVDPVLQIFGTCRNCS